MDGFTPRYAAYDATEKRVGGGVVRTHVPRRTPEERAAFLRGIDRAIRGAFPGWRLKQDESENGSPGA